MIIFSKRQTQGDFFHALHVHMHLPSSWRQIQGKSKYITIKTVCGKEVDILWIMSLVKEKSIRSNRLCINSWLFFLLLRNDNSCINEDCLPRFSLSPDRCTSFLQTMKWGLTRTKKYSWIILLLNYQLHWIPNWTLSSEGPINYGHQHCQLNRKTAVTPLTIK